MWMAPGNEEDSISKDRQNERHCETGYPRHPYGFGSYSCKRNYSIILIRGVAWPCMYFRKFTFTTLIRILRTIGEEAGGPDLLQSRQGAQKGEINKEGTNLMAI